MKRLEQLTVTGLERIHTIRAEKGHQSTITNRPYYGLHFCINSQITYTHNSRKFVTDRDHAILLPMGESYSLVWNHTGECPLIDFLTTPDFAVREFLVLPLHNPDQYLQDFEQLKELNLFSHNRPLVMSLFYNMINRLIHEHQTPANPLSPLLSWLEKHYTDWDLSLPMLAEQSGFSEIYLRQLFHKYQGVSPKQYIQALRMQKARQLLSEGTLPVTVIAAQCGFSSIHHFCRAFKEVNGQTPGEYRNNNRYYTF